MEPWNNTNREGSMLLAYDCPASKEGERRRRQLRKLCVDLTRIQYSVYLGTVAKTQIIEAVKRVHEIIEPTKDRVVIVDISASKWTEFGLGPPGIKLPPSALVVLTSAAVTVDRAQRIEPEKEPERIHTDPEYAESNGRWATVGGHLDGWIDWMSQ